jgi:hypothetical protein
MTLDPKKKKCNNDRLLRTNQERQERLNIRKKGGEDEWEVPVTIYRGGAAGIADTEGDDTVVASGGRLGIWTTDGLPAVARLFHLWPQSIVLAIEKDPRVSTGDASGRQGRGAAGAVLSRPWPTSEVRPQSSAEDVLGWPRIPGFPLSSRTFRDGAHAASEQA